MKFFAILLVAFAAAAQASDVREAWEQFKADYGKVYENGKEHARRFSIFKKNFDYINEHNKLFESGKSTYSLGINAYADMTNEEFVAQFNGYKSGSKSIVNQYVADSSDLPKSVDWRKKGYVTPIKNQKQCGSCWSFSATGSIEGAHFKKTGKLVSLSEQNIMDCDKKSHSCEGGLMDYAFNYVIQNKGIDTEASYPYKAKDESCKFKKANIGATISSYKDITEGSEKDLTTAIANEGPISVAIDASHISFQLYHSGVYDEPHCSSSALDHGVLAVGYGSDDNGKDYYIVKNSWGTTWGDKGYILMSRNKNNQCGIATKASFPIA